jgi:hypothetical protein
MRKLLLSVFVSLAAIIAFPLSASAAAAQTDVSGTVTNNGVGVSGAKVTVVCDNNARHDTTDASGGYLVTYPAKDCPAGSHVDVVATKKKSGGYDSGTANPIDTKLNVALVNVSLPEMGLITGAAAVLGAGVTFLVVRRRQIGQN